MNKKGKGIKGQTELSFGMIFSIILIIIFIAFAVYGIIKFLNINKSIQVESFKKDFQGNIDALWRNPGSSIPVSYSLPNKIKQVCFTDNPDQNMYFMPFELDYAGAFLQNIDITKTIAGSTSRPKTFCIDTHDGKISMNIKNGYNEIKVVITK